MTISEFDATALHRRYRDLQRYVHWVDEDAARIRAALPLVQLDFVRLIDDFYVEISRHEEAHRVITGGAEQINRLKQTLRTWLAELFSGQYDASYVERRWRVGLRHVEIGLDQVYTNVALSCLRSGLVMALESHWQGSREELAATRQALHKLLDLDLAIIEDAYQSEHLQRQQRTERLIAVGQMAAGVAHELRNPLNVMKTSVYYLLNTKNCSEEKIAEHLHRVERQVGLADRVITALSDFAKLPFPQVRRLEVADCVSEALELTNLPPEIHVASQVAPNALAIWADPDQFRIVLLNLFRNAREAMGTGGNLSIHAEEVNGFVEIAVADNGEGIPRESLARVMEPLYSTKARGLGLGLAITRAIVEKHRGRLRVESELGKGSTFFLSLPKARLDGFAEGRDT